MTVLYSPSRQDIERAHDSWGANCGPCSLATALSLSMPEVGRLFPSFFSGRTWTNISSMNDALNAAVAMGWCHSWWRIFNAEWPHIGLALVQFEGPWTAPGANPKWAATQTHWVAVALRRFGDVEEPRLFVYDVNGPGAGWTSRNEWEAKVLPELLKDVSRASGKYNIKALYGVRPTITRQAMERRP